MKLLRNVEEWVGGREGYLHRSRLTRTNIFGEKLHSYGSSDSKNWRFQPPLCIPHIYVVSNIGHNTYVPTYTYICTVYIHIRTFDSIF